MKKYLCTILLFLFMPVVFVSAASLGERTSFNVDAGYELRGKNQVMATLRHVGKHIYFYVEDDYWNSLGAGDRNALASVLSNLASEFDTVIYPKERAVFGSEWSPGIDNDVKITALVLELVKGAGGYFNTYDGYSKAIVPSSNEREMFYLNALTISDPYNKGYMAHEFQHLINFYQKTVVYGLEEDIWLNEAKSEYAPTVCGYDYPYSGSYLADRVDVFLDHPSDPLAEWKNKVADYGTVNLFLHYLIDRFGTEFLTRLSLNDKVGIASIEQALIDMKQGVTFSDVFADWVVANYLNNCGLDTEGRYCYKNRDLTHERLHVDYSFSYSGFPNLIVSRSSTVSDWSPHWYRFSQGTPQATDRDTLKLEFDGLDGSSDFRVPYVVIGPNNQITVSTMSLDGQKGAIYVPNFSSQGKSVIMIPFSQRKKSNFGSSDPTDAFSFTALSIESHGVVASSLSPISGSDKGGYEITIKGDNLTDVGQISFGGVNIPDFKIVDKETISFVAPTHKLGSVDLVLTDNSGQQSVLSGAFTYAANSAGNYPDGSLLRAAGDYKVYIINGGYKRWIQDARIFNAYGHLKWADVIEVSQAVLNGYQESRLIRSASDKRVYEVDANGVKRWLNITAAQFTSSGRDWGAVYIINDYERDFYQTGSHITN